MAHAYMQYLIRTYAENAQLIDSETRAAVEHALLLLPAHHRRLLTLLALGYALEEIPALSKSTLAEEVSEALDSLVRTTGYDDSFFLREYGSAHVEPRIQGVILRYMQEGTLQGGLFC